MRLLHLSFQNTHRVLESFSAEECFCNQVKPSLLSRGGEGGWGALWPISATVEFFANPFPSQEAWCSLGS